MDEKEAEAHPLMGTIFLVTWRRERVGYARLALTIVTRHISLWVGLVYKFDEKSYCECLKR